MRSRRRSVVATKWLASAASTEIPLNAAEMPAGVTFPQANYQITTGFVLSTMVKHCAAGCDQRIMLYQKSATRHGGQNGSNQE